MHEEHSGFILLCNLIGLRENKRHYVTEIVSWPGFADVIFRSYNRKYVCCSQARSKPDEENLRKQVTESQFTFKAVKELEILKELKNLKQKKASGLDNFPPGMLKDAALVLT